MDTSPLKQRWHDGGTALGAWISLRDPLLAEVAGTAGYDYVCIDMQHGMSDYTHITSHLHALARTPAVPIVRVDDRTIGSGVPGPITRALLDGFRKKAQAMTRRPTAVT